MKNVIILAIVVVIVVGGGALLISKHHSSYVSPSTTSGMATMNMPMSSPETSGSKAASTTNSVVINNYAFSPAAISIKKGMTVTWTNKDSVTHTVTENDGQTGPDSGNLPTGKSYSFTFNTVGTFKYYCSIHPDMLGTVTVTE